MHYPNVSNFLKSVGLCQVEQDGKNGVLKQNIAERGRTKVVLKTRIDGKTERAEENR